MSSQINNSSDSMSVYFSCHNSLYKDDYEYLNQSLKKLAELPNDFFTQGEYESILSPTIVNLDKLGEEGFNQLLEDKKKASQTRYLKVLIDALLQRNFSCYSKVAYKDLLAFQALVSSFHQEVLNCAISDLVQNTLFPIAVWGTTPYTYFPKNLDEDIFGDLSQRQVTIVELPYSLSNTGIQAWSSIGHEAGGHHFLRSVPGLIRELAKKLEIELKQEQGINEHFPTYFSSCIEELASDVLGVLNMGPAFGIGLAMYLRAKNTNDQFSKRGPLHSKKSTPSRTVRISSESLSEDLLVEKVNSGIKWPDSGNFGMIGEHPVNFEKVFIPVNKHPMDIFRVWGIMNVVALLDINEEAKKGYLESIKEIIGDQFLEVSDLIFKKFFNGQDNKAELIRIPLDECKKASEVAMRIIASLKLSSIKNSTLIDLFKWDNIDEKISSSISSQLSKRNKELIRPGFVDQDKILSRHIVSASILKSVNIGNEDKIFKKMKHWLRDEATKVHPGETLYDSDSFSYEIPLGSDEETLTLSLSSQDEE